MKKLILLFITVLFVAVSYAQPGSVKTTVVDTLNDAETVNFASIPVKSAWTTLTMQAVCTEIGGTADGFLYLQASVDGTSFITIDDLQNNAWINLYSADTTAIASNGNEYTITDGGVLNAVIAGGTPWNYYRWQGVGTSNDTTLITTKYVYKSMFKNTKRN